MIAKKALIILAMIRMFSGNAQANEKYYLVKVWPEVPPGWHFYQPWGIAIDGLGNVYIADSGNYRIKKFDSEGKFMLQWGSLSKGDGQFRSIVNIKVDRSGIVYVVDWDREKWAHNRIQKFTSFGQFIGMFERKAPGVDKFELPVDVAVCPWGNVFVLAVDYAPGNKRRGPVQIEKYSPKGKFLTRWGSVGTGEGQFVHPAGIAIDTQGNVYIIDQGNHRIQKFNSNGRFITKWGARGEGDGLFNDPRSIAFNKVGDVYVLDRYSIQKFTPEGEFLTKYKIMGRRANRIAVDTHGNMYVTDVIASKVMKFKPNGYLIKEWGSASNSDGQFNTPRGITLDAQDNVFICEEGNKRIQKFDSQGKFLSKWESNVTWKDRVCTLATDTFGNLYTLTAYNVQKLDTDGNVVAKWGAKGSEDSQFNNAKGIAIDRFENVYVADTGNYRIQKFTNKGKFMAKWGSKGSDDGQFETPEGIAVDNSGNVYVCDREDCRIQKFDSNGRFLIKWGKEGSGKGEFHFPAAIALDKNGNVYVADSENHRIQEFTSKGKFLTEWGEFGEAPGQLSVPLGIAVDYSGNVYVSDSHNHRIQKFAPVRSP